MQSESGSAARRSQTEETQNSLPLRSRLLWPLLAVVALLLVLFLVVMAVREEAAIREETRRLAEELRYDVNYQMQLEVRLMSAIADSLAARQELVRALQQRDRERLLSESSALFARLKGDFHITHFYYHDAEGINLLRVHAPGHRGDRIERSSLHAAAQTGRVASGIEEGPFGPFTLRVVLPVLVGGKIIGYIELGEEIADILRGVHQHLGLEVLLLRDKQLLERGRWEKAMLAQEQKPDWERFADHVVIYHSQRPLAPAFDVVVRRLLQQREEQPQDWSLGTQNWQAQIFPFTAGEAASAAQLLIMRDVTPQARDYRRTVFSLALAALGLLVGIYFVLGSLLRRADRALRAQQKALREVRGRLQAVLDNVPLGIWLIDGEGRCLFANTTFRRDFNLGQGDLSTTRLALALGGIPEDLSLDQALERYGALPAEQSMVFADRREHLVEIRRVPVHDAKGRLTGLLGIYDDQTDRKASAEKVRLYANLFEHGGEAMLITDRHNRIIDLNPAFTRLTGYTLDEVRGENPRILSSERTPPEVYPELWHSLYEQGFWQGELWDKRKDGMVYPKWVTISLIRDALGEVVYHTASFTDISERKAAEERIEHLAHRDTLTGLFNRYSLESRLGQALMAAQRDGRSLAVMFLDLDRFKQVNDTLGHPVGDQLLIAVADRLQTCVRGSDILARLGGDEFVVVLTGMEAESDVLCVTNKILDRLGADYLIEGRQLHCSPSIGISVFPADGDTPEQLMKHADVAMYHAKEQGRNNAQFFKAELNQRAGERSQLGQDLRFAVARSELSLEYQPQVEAQSGRLIGVEALVRWQHPLRGTLYPGVFIELAEEIGVIRDLGRWVLEEACRQLAEWHTAGLADLRMAINISAHQLRAGGFADLVSQSMLRHGLPPGALELEITESTAMGDPEHAVAQLAALRLCGVELAIDDFGTGYSSLAYLKHLPIQTLKLDRSFVKDIALDANDTAICAATLALAKTLGLKVVAEGVEHAGQHDFLVSHGCDTLQGYFIGAPMSAQDFGEWLGRRDGRPAG